MSARFSAGALRTVLLSLIIASHEHLRVCHVNCQSLYAHLDEFRLFFQNSGYHIVCMSETWLRPAISDDMVRLPGYTLFRCDRIGRAGGGVGFFLINSGAISATILESTGEDYYHKPEYMFAEISVDNASRLLLAIIYRPPHCGHLISFEERFLELQTAYLHSIIMGDFNVNMAVDNFDSAQLRSFISSSGSYLVPYRATHCLRLSSTLIDHCIVDDEDKVMKHGQHGVPFLSAHDLIFITYNIKIERRHVRHITCRDFHPEDFLTDVGNINWDHLFVLDDIYHKVVVFNDFLLNCLDKHAPLRRLRARHAPAPWLSTELKAAMRERDKARRIWRRRRDEASFLHFKKLRNEVQARVRHARRTYYNNAFKDLRNSGDVWAKLRHLGLVRTAGVGRRLPCPINELNEFAGGSASSDVGFADLCSSSVSVGPFSDRQFHWWYMTPTHITTAFRRSHSNAGMDGVSLYVLRTVLPQVIHVIEHIYNSSIMHGIFLGPRTALICPIPKVKNPSAARDYRPIALLPVLSKVLERMVCDQMLAYLEGADLLDPCQSAFKKGHSTQTALIRVLDDVRCAADNRMITITVFFDLSKAFDRINHQILLGKLRQLNLSDHTLHWFLTYLTRKSQMVRDPMSGDISQPVSINTGVPQGSVLGPLLFTLYISDIKNVINHCSYNIYADDLLIYLHCRPCDIADGINMVNHDIDGIIAWARRNDLVFNADKTKAMIMGTRRFVASILPENLPCITIDGTPIHFSDNVKYLGVTLSSNLSWGLHVESTTKRIRITLYQLKLCRDLMPDDLKQRLVASLILPYVDYCCVAFTDIPADLSTKLSRAVNASIRFIFSIRRNSHITPFYDKLRWLKIQQRRIYFVGCLLFSIIESRCPPLLYGELRFRAGASGRDTRAAPDVLYVPPCRTETYKRSFRMVAASFWNGLSERIRRSDSLRAFKASLYKHLLAGSRVP